MPTSSPPSAGPEAAVWVGSEVAGSVLVLLVEVRLLGVGATRAADLHSANNLGVSEHAVLAWVTHQKLCIVTHTHTQQFLVGQYY